MNILQGIKTTYHGPTNFKGSRVSACIEVKKITLPWDSALNSDENHFKAAMQLATALNWLDETKTLLGASIPKYKKGYLFRVIKKAAL